MALFMDKALSYAVSQGNREGGKSHALSNKPTIYRQGFHFASTLVYVSGFITAVQMMFYSTSAVWCFYRPDTPHSFLAFKRNDYRNVIGYWGET